MPSTFKTVLNTVRTDIKDAVRDARTVANSVASGASNAVRHVADGFDSAADAVARIPNLVESKIERPYVTAHDGFVAFDASGNVVRGRQPSATLRDYDVPHTALDPVLNLVNPPEQGALQFTLPGGTTLTAQADSQGRHSVALSSVPRTQLDPAHGGLLHVGIVTPEGKGDDARVLALPKDYDGPVFVCDIDDTLRPTKIVDVVLGRGQKPIEGAVALLQQVARQNVPIVYLSAGSDRIRPVNAQFLKQFPPGVLLDRLSIGLHGLDPRNSAQADAQGEYKTEVLNELKATFPNAQLFGLGDDKYGDATAYTRAGATAYIHDLPDYENLPADFHGMKTAAYSPDFIQKVSADLKDAAARSATFGGTPSPKDARTHAAQLSSVLDAVTSSKLLPGNSMELLIDGEAALPKILAALDGATTSIAYETYNFLPGDPVSDQLADRLIAARARGVQVRVVLDAFGAREFPLHKNPTIARLRDAGVEVQVYNPLNALSDLLPHRDHRKTIVVDDRTAFLGGMNSAQAWMGGPDVKRRWHDAFAQIEGPAVHEVARAFRDSWVSSEGAFFELPAEVRRAAPGMVPMRIIPHVPGKDRNIEAAYLALIDNAQTNINLENTFPMADGIKDSLIAAAQRGVKVRYIIGSDQGLIGLANDTRLQELLDAGVEIYVYPGRVHTKALSVDGAFATLGSSNTDEISLDRNREIIALIEDPDSVAQLDQALFERDLQGDDEGRKTLQLPRDLSKPVWDRLGAAVVSRVWPAALQ